MNIHEDEFVKTFESGFNGRFLAIALSTYQAVFRGCVNLFQCCGIYSHSDGWLLAMTTIQSLPLLTQIVDQYTSCWEESS